MVDITELVLLGASFFFVALSAVLLVKYREVSQRINVSTDLGRDLWASLEQRLKKQDERVLDMMARVDVIQSRAMVVAAAQLPEPSPVRPEALPIPSRPESRAEGGQAASPPVQQPESHGSPASRVVVPVPKPVSNLDETQLAALKLLGEAPKNTRQLTDALGKSREHTARIMKELFEMGLVQRNASAKPFVYQLTDEGKGRVSSP